MSRDPLTDDQVRAALAELPGWRHAGDALVRTFAFDGFRAALAFIVRVGFEAEQRDHHPTLTNVYDRVEVTLTTHDAGDRVTARDVDLARAIEKIGP